MQDLQIYSDNSLKTDLYELTMAAGYFVNKVDTKATFELSCHTMPPNRSYLVACGLEQIAEYILNLRFQDEHIQFLKTIPALKGLPKGFFEYLRDFKFTGDVWAFAEGEVFFAQEPILQIEAPIIEAQILETFLLSTANLQSVVATKASRIVQSACSDGVKRGIIDFGSRRAHGVDAGVLASRASYIAGALGTSNVCAGKRFGIPVYGTMAHSWVESFKKEEEAFEKYNNVFPDNTILLVDTYDTIKAVEKIKTFKFKERINGVRLDSGDLAALSKQTRKILDKDKLSHIKIIASGNLNEYKISELVKNKSPIDLFGVGTDMVTSRDYPTLDLTYKLVQITQRSGKIEFKAKKSPQKQTVPGRKQVYRKFSKTGKMEKDTIALFDEKVPGDLRPLLKPVIQGGKLKEPLPSLKGIKGYLQAQLSALEESYFDLAKEKKYKIELSEGLASIFAKPSSRGAK
ncbi:MAG: nicotinate phosphoribosyltransferase [Omnitrophica WOR_2 bacterium GWA2_47_8]|nr:MAG: nicotinate phosphoribosyltransferase [Omnitrophica WOR_2 bacterium GWA2_47_8]